MNAPHQTTDTKEALLSWKRSYTPPPPQIHTHTHLAAQTSMEGGVRRRERGENKGEKMEEMWDKPERKR